ncbi:AraC family transcriptional regulator [Marinigracilibium pacificum]|uniref:Helix-turn-helix transcriptional regulator n=1 Tax=Marinigracilibium pacificum TaxID=2729599 RepID=A0A848IVJ3_9BACT|nr:helix-turn-helix domain-containing protein [Marinigracilibium pacificum]NMM48357.1 helix-turn-helix transcriptional regulator [Marinigracilibium pacificum]
MKEAIFTWAFIQSFLVGAIIFFVKRAKINTYLSLLFISIGFKILTQYLMRFTPLRETFPEIIFLPDVFDLIEPVLLFFYFKSICGKNIDRSQYLFFLPAIIVLISGTIYVLSGNFNSMFSYIHSSLHLTNLTTILIWKIGFFYKIFYEFKNIKSEVLKQKQQNLLSWPKILTIFMGFTVFVALILWIYHILIVPNFNVETKEYIRISFEMIFILFNCSIILITGYFFLRNPKIFSGIPLIKTVDEKDFPEGKYYVEKLDKLLAETNIHLETDLNEKKLAEKLEIQPYLLSRLLNDYLGKSFSEFINEKRVIHAKGLLQNESSKKLTIFSIGVDSGFNSESVFYVNFKKHTGFTPAQYRKHYNKKD